MRNKHFILEDGRGLAYAEYGPEGGFPILYCHGSQSSRFEMHYDWSFAEKHHLRIINIDRPGHGESDYNKKGTIESFAADVNQLIHSLAIKEYAVLGMSAGAPFAMGIAKYLDHKPESLGIVSGFAPFETENQEALGKEVRLLLNIAKRYPFVLNFMLKIQHWQLKRNTPKALRNFLKIMSSSDQKVLESEAVMEVIENMFKEAFKHGSRGVAHEISKILVQDWGFDLGDIEVPTFIWHGAEDNNVPLTWAKSTYAKIENSHLKVFHNEGHLIIFKNAEEIFTSLKLVKH